MIDLSGKTVLVTGGSRGIGAAIVRAVAGVGANVLLHYGKSRGAGDFRHQWCELCSLRRYIAGCR
jgi:NAD(P)-dependent dehydrogenase (short-subunit alcohol dehydrogenase family)